MTEVNVHIDIEVDPDELWFCTFGSSFETWDWWANVEYLDGADWDKPGKVRLSIWTDPDDHRVGKTNKTIDIDDLLFAVERAVVECVDACTGRKIVVTPGDVDFDACVGDCILQIAVLGEVVFG
jgi:hypothetical protein